MDGDFWSGRRVALGALAIALLYVGALWAGARWGWIHAFHGPRYPGLVAGIWAIGLVAASRDLSDHLGRRWPGAVLIAPWFVASFFALDGMRRQGAAREERSLARQVRDAVVDTHQSIVFAPPELEPFFPRTIAALGARPLSELPCRLARGEDVALLFANRWKEVDTPTSLLLHTAIARGRLLASSRASIPLETGDYALASLSGVGSDTGLTRAWCARGISAASRGALPPWAIEIDLASQRRSDGWSYLEFDRELRAFRWTAATAARLRLPETFPAGEVALVIEGSSPEGPGEVVVRKAGLNGSRNEKAKPLPQGPFSVTLELPATTGAGPRRDVELRCSTVRDSGSPEGFHRTLGVQVRRVYFVPRR